jgi:hypothetical protein
VEQLRQVAMALGFAPTWDAYVPADCAAALLGRQPGTLANWRSFGPVELPHRRRGRRIEYSLQVIAARLEAEDES